MTGLAERYPRTTQCDGQSFELRLMQVADRDLVEQFAAELPRHDLLFLSRDIRAPRVVDAWAEQIASGEITSLVAEADGKMVGCSAIVRDARSWSPHVGEVRVLLGEAQRKVGLGRQLIQESVWVAAAEGLEKLTARMTSDQTGALDRLLTSRLRRSDKTA